MKNHAHKGTLFLALILVGACASSTNVQDAIGQLDADAQGARIEAIQQLGQSSDPRAGEVLVAVLEDSSGSAVEREEIWLEVARALDRLAGKGLVGEEALPALDRLAAQRPGVGSRDSDADSALDQAPLFPYDRVAGDAAQTIRLKGAQRSTGKQEDDRSGKTQAQFLAELAWIQRVDEDGRVHETALEQLKKLGAEGVAPSAKLIGTVRPQSRGEMVAYFQELHAETGDEACARALVALASSQHEDAWRPALVALRKMGDASVSKTLVKRLETGGAPDTPRTHLALAAVGGIGSEEAIPFLVGLFASDSPEVARSASRALIDVGPASVPALLDELDHIDRQHRLMAALALSRLDNRQGREATRRFLGAARGDDEETMDEIRRNLAH